MSPPTPTQATPHRFDLRGALACCVGSMVGIGIFLAPSAMARAVSHPWAFIGLWVLATVGALGGASAYGALGMRMPRSGGDVVFQREAFGPALSFATGQVLFLAVFCGSAAAIAAAIGQYQVATITGWAMDAPLITVPLLGPITGAKLVGVTVVIVLTGIQDAGARWTDRTLRVLTWIPVGILTVMAIGAIAMRGAGALPAPPPPPALTFSPGALVAAWLGAHFAYSGWNAIIYAAGEVDEPARTLPRAMGGAALLVGSLYILLNIAFVSVLGMGALAEAGEVGTALATAMGGPEAGRWMSALIAVGLLGTVHASMFGGAWVAWAMGRQGDLPAFVGRRSARDTPSGGLWLQAGWASVLILGNGFDVLLETVGLAMVLIGGLSVAGLFVIRRRELVAATQAGVAPPPAGWGMPWLPGLHLALAVVVLMVEVAELRHDDASLTPLLGLAVLGGAWALRKLWPGFGSRPDNDSAGDRGPR